MMLVLAVTMSGGLGVRTGTGGIIVIIDSTRVVSNKAAPLILSRYIH